MPSPDPYAILGLPKDASPEDVRKAYREKAKDSHPDTGGNAKEFAIVKLAHDVLSDPDRRRKFDETGEINETEPNTIDAQAMSLLAGAINGIIDGQHGQDPMTVDWVKVISGNLKDEIKAGEQKRKDLEGQLKKCEKVASKFKRKKKSEPNMVTLLMQQRIDHIKAMFKEIDKQISVFKRAIEMIEDYTFDADKPPETTRAYFPPNYAEQQYGYLYEQGIFNSVFGKKK